MENKKINIFFLLAALLFFSVSCEDLEVENLNAPDTKTALSSKGDVVGLAGGAFRVWHNATQEYSGPALAMLTMADQGTCSWGNVGMNDMSSEPRMGWNNNVSYANSAANRDLWQDLYAVTSQVNDVLSVIDAGEIDFGEDEAMLRAWSYFVQGVSMGYIGLVYDQGFIVDETTDLAVENPTKTYKEMTDAAVGYLDKAITACGTSFVLPDGFIRGSNYTNVQLAELANSFAARILAYSPRNAAENTAVAWNRVLDYANDGITQDLAPNMDDNSWWDNYKGYGSYPGWVRIDHRIINLMDNAYPSRWPNDNASWNTPDGNDLGEASSADARLASDFEYLSDNNFKPDRGYYHFSHYKYNRYADWMTTWTGPAPSFRVAENDLLKAEALLRTGNKPEAINVINAGSRTVRGGLADIDAGASDAQVLEAIFYERDIELIMTGLGISFFDMRRRDMLQSGTILHFPIPGIELESLFMDYYTIGGSPDGVNVSDGSWTGKDGLTSPPSK